MAKKNLFSLSFTEESCGDRPDITWNINVNNISRRYYRKGFISVYDSESDRFEIYRPILIEGTVNSKSKWLDWPDEDFSVITFIKESDNTPIEEISKIFKEAFRVCCSDQRNWKSIKERRGHRSFNGIRTMIPYFTMYPHGFSSGPDRYTTNVKVPNFY